MSQNQRNFESFVLSKVARPSTSVCGFTKFYGFQQDNINVSVFSYFPFLFLNDKKPDINQVLKTNRNDEILEFYYDKKNVA